MVSSWFSRPGLSYQHTPGFRVLEEVLLLESFFDLQGRDIVNNIFYWAATKAHLFGHGGNLEDAEANGVCRVSECIGLFTKTMPNLIMQNYRGNLAITWGSSSSESQESYRL